MVSQIIKNEVVQDLRLKSQLKRCSPIETASITGRIKSNFKSFFFYTLPFSNKPEKVKFTVDKKILLHFAMLTSSEAVLKMFKKWK